ncbi:MAG: acyl-CoA thioester hydrolase/BAAT C-terminal domain-containing protein [Gaiellaceae bacterium]
MKLRFAVVLSAALALAGPAHAAVRVSVTPAAALVDAPVDIRVTGLAPRASVTLQATTKDYLGKLWRSRLAVRADGHGVYDTHGGMRLFWSMQCVSRAIGCNFGAPFGPTDVDMDVIRAGRVAGQAVLSRSGVATDVVQTDTTLAAQGFVGAYFAPPAGAAPAPAVLQIGGSEGGYSAYPAALFASHGYPTLSLAYFKEPGLPQTLKDIPLEYFATALRWLAAQPGVDPKRVVLFGASRGGEGALLIGSTYPDLVHAVIADVPSDQVKPFVHDNTGFAWTLAGKPIPYGPIPVEKIGGPVLALGAGRDGLWDSFEAVKSIVARARAHGRTDFVGVEYPLAGHVLLFVPNTPPFEVAKVEVAPGDFTFLYLGGTPAANAAAQVSSWARVLRFMAAL